VGMRKGPSSTSGVYDSYLFSSQIQSSPSALNTRMNVRVATIANGTITVDGGPEDRVGLGIVGCGICSGASIEGQLGDAASQTFSAPFVQASDGSFAVMQQGGALAGSVSPDGNLVMMEANGDAGILLGVKRGASTPDITGRYNFVLIGESISTTGNFTAKLTTGSITFADDAEVEYSQTSVIRREACGTPCATVSAGSQNGYARGPYTVDATGHATLTVGTDLPFVVQAAFSPDAQVAVLTHRVDNEADGPGRLSERMIGLALRQ
jgi:hypothetical protein